MALESFRAQYPEMPDFLALREVEALLPISRASVKRTREQMLSLILPNNTVRSPLGYTALVKKALEASHISKGVTVAREFSLRPDTMDIVAEEEQYFDHLLVTAAENNKIGTLALSHVLYVGTNTIRRWRENDLIEGSGFGDTAAYAIGAVREATYWQLPEALRDES